MDIIEFTLQIFLSLAEVITSEIKNRTHIYSLQTYIVLPFFLQLKRI